MTNSTACNLLVSARSLDESTLLQKLQVPWIDLKEPRNGPLGRPSLTIAQLFASRMLQSRNTGHWSIAGGELSDWNVQEDAPFIHSLGAKGHIKWGLANSLGLEGWECKLASLVEQLPDPQQAILVHYADSELVQSPPWDSVMQQAKALGIGKVLIDTAIKNGKTLQDHIPLARLAEKIRHSQGLGLQIAIAGSIPLEDLKIYSQLNPNWIGIRGAVCSNPLQRESTIDPNLVSEALAQISDPTHV
ncbi:MAG: (5-formylfuran-3-yl)methyl phosphate synthase [Pirellula sp.]